MADKQAVFTLRVDTGNSVQDVQNFDQALNKLNTNLDDSSQSLNRNATFAQRYGDELQPLTTRLGEAEDRLYELALAGQQASDEYKELLETVSNYRKTQIAVDAVVDASAQTMGMKLVSAVEFGAGAFQGIQSAIALTGTESEALVQTMVKLQAAQGLVNAVQTVANQLNKNSILMLQLRNLQEKGLVATITQSTIAQKINNIGNVAATGIMKVLGLGVNSTSMAFKGLKAALLASGIGAIVVLVGSLVSGMMNLLSSTEKNKEAIDKEREATQKRMQAKQEEFDLDQKLRAAQGATPLELEIEKRKKLQTELQDLQYAETQANKKFHRLKAKDWGAMNDNTKAAYDREIELEDEVRKKLNEIRESEIELMKLKNEEKIKNLQETYDKVNNQYKRDIDLAKAQGKETFQMEKDALKNKIFQAKADSEEQKDLQNQLKILEVNHNKEMSDKRKTFRKKRIDNLRKEREEIIAELKKLNDDQLALEEERQKLMFELVAEGREKELLKAEQDAENFKKAFIDKRTQDERDALDEQFKQGKITRAEYDKKTLELRVFALNSLSDKEKEVLTLRDQVLAQDRAEINKKYDAEALAKKKETQEKLLEIFLTQFEQEKLAAQKDTEDKIKLLDDSLKDGLISQFEYNLAKEKLLKDLADKEKQIEKDKNEFIKEQGIKAREEQLKRISEIIEGAQKGLDGLKQVNDLVNQIDQARLNSLAKNREEDLANLDANLQAQLNQEGLTADQRTAIEQKFAQQKYNVQLKAFEQEEKIKKAQFNREKALRLAQVGIDTASAIVKGIAQFGPPPSPPGIAAIASAGLIGITQAMAIMNQQYQAGSAPSPPQLGAGGSAGNLTGASASSFTANTNAQTTDLTTLGQGQGQNIPVSQVVVLESDITGTQNKVKLQEAKTSF